MDCSPNFASDGRPRSEKMEVMIRMAIDIMVNVPFAVDNGFFRPDEVYSGTGRVDVFFIIYDC